MARSRSPTTTCRTSQKRRRILIEGTKTSNLPENTKVLHTVDDNNKTDGFQWEDLSVDSKQRNETEIKSKEPRTFLSVNGDTLGEAIEENISFTFDDFFTVYCNL
ncbi:chaperone protein dnaK [Acrasis kona]|uniref:Chaperone protein dnaK n=1 Tax=Acrasis kona TaxID=1008807 RepID=A0AAW2ZR57_9EUKA